MVRPVPDEQKFHKWPFDGLQLVSKEGAGQERQDNKILVNKQYKKIKYMSKLQQNDVHSIEELNLWVRLCLVTFEIFLKISV